MNKEETNIQNKIQRNIERQIELFEKYNITKYEIVENKIIVRQDIFLNHLIKIEDWFKELLCLWFYIFRRIENNKRKLFERYYYI
jgi:hypothetical protein